MRPEDDAVTAVVVNFRSQHYLMELIPALLQDDAVSDIVVVDNSPEDGARDAVLSRFSEVSWVDSGGNVGFAKAVNLGLRQVREAHLLLINPDCVPMPGAIGSMLRHLNSHPRCGIVAPLTIHPDRELKFLAAGEQPTARSLLNHYLGVSELFPHREWAKGWHLRNQHHSAEVRTVGWASGACLLIRSEVHRELGGLSEEWFMYAEDMHYCLRTTAAGWEIHHTPDAVVSHVIGGSTHGTSTRWISVLIDYNRRYLSKSPVASWVSRCVLSFGFLARAGRDAALALRSNRHRDDGFEAASADLRCAWRSLRPERTGLDLAPAAGPGGEPRSRWRRPAPARRRR